MKIKKYTNGAWTDLDKPVKKFNTYTDEATTLPLTIETSKTDAVDNYQVYGTSEGAGVETENLWKVENDMLAQSKWELNPPVVPTAGIVYFINYKLSDLQVSALKNGICTCTIFEHFSEGYAAKKLVCAISPTASATIPEEYRILNNQGVVYTRTFDFSSWDNVYLIIGFSDSFASPQITQEETVQIKQDKIDELFTNWLISITHSSTAPTTYIPYGYKIPILNTSGVTENLWDLDSSWTNSQTDSRDFFNARLMCLNGSTVVADKYLQINANGQYSIAITSADTNYNRILFKHSGSTKDLVIGEINGDFSSQDSYTISFSVLGYNPSIAGGIKVENIMLVKGSTAPDHYIPYRYETNYDLFIGDSKLYEDEYLDFGEQKVYKRTENLFDKNAKDTNNGYVRWHAIISTGAVAQDSSWDVTEYINVKPSTVYTASNCVGVGASICFYDTNKEYISGIPYNLPKPGGYGTLTFTTPNNCAYARTCVLTVNQSSSGYEFERNVDVFMITEGSTAPESYDPYYQPVDPPVPLPTISTYIGENNISVDTTVQPEKVAVEYEGWKGVGDVEKYQNGEWSDNNGT